MRRLPLGLLLVVTLAACDTPTFQGPMVQSLPEGYLRQAGAAQDHEVFDREIVFREAYTKFGMDFSGIYIRGYPGTTTRRQVQEAIERAKATDGSGELIQMTYQSVEDLLIDGQAAWGWMEETRDRNGLQYVEYRLVVPYDTITYTVEYTTGDPILKIAPDSLRAIAQSFAVGKTTYDFGLIGLVAVIGLFGGTFLMQKAAAKKPSTSYELISMPAANPDDHAPELDVAAARDAAAGLDELDAGLEEMEPPRPDPTSQTDTTTKDPGPGTA